MRVLLTGGAGYIGSHTALALLEAGHEVIVLDNLSNASDEAPRRVEKITGKELSLIVGDCTDEKTVRNVFQEHSPIDAVIHFAGLKAVGESVEKPLAYYQNNLNATLTLCKVMTDFSCFSLVFSSSATVYGACSEAPFREDAPTGCASPYGWTKWMNEQILRDIAQADSRMRIVMLRYFNPIGAHPSGEIGEDPSGKPNNLMPYVCQVASGKQDVLRVFGNDYDTPDGTGVRDYIHVCDLADGHLAALNYALSNPGCEIINLGTGKGYSVLELVHTFEKTNNISIPLIFTERRPGDIAVSYADASKAEKLLHWKATRNLTDMCRDAWNWQRKNPKGYPEHDE